MMVGRLLSYWEGNFAGAMLNFGKVLLMEKNPAPVEVGSSSPLFAWF